MSLSSRNALNTYSQVGLDVKVAAASPHALIAMLLDGAIIAINKAHYLLDQIHGGSKEVQLIADKGAAISKAIAIIEDGLKASLNLEVGGELAANLYGLYDYLAHRLVEANLNNEVAILDEVVSRLSELKEAWESIELRKDTSQSAHLGTPTLDASGLVTYGKV